MDNFTRSKIIVNLLLNKIPYIYLNNIYEEIKRNKVHKKYEGSDEDAVEFINNLYLDEESNFKIDIVKEYDNLNLYNYIVDNKKNLLINNINFYSKIEKVLMLKDTNYKEVLKNYKYFEKLFFCLINNKKVDLKKISKVNIFLKHKKGDTSDINNFRFLFQHNMYLKMIDKILTNELINSMIRNNNIPDTNIYINNINKIISDDIREKSNQILLNMDNKILIDVSKAYDSINRNVLYKILTNVLTEKVSKLFASRFLNLYDKIISNRVIYYNDKEVNISKGIPTGLSSSNIIFILIFEYIFKGVIKQLNNKNIIHDKDYKLKIYVDDIAINIISVNKAKIIYDTITNNLNFYGFKVNKIKTKASKNLNLYLKELKCGDMYLGLPFSNSIKNFLDIILKEFNSKYCKITYKDILRIKKLKDIDIAKDLLKYITGFFNYKLYGLKKYNIPNSFDNISEVINLYYKN